MDIKSLVRNVLPNPLQSLADIRRNRATDTSADRDPNGQAEREAEDSKRPMTEEEIQEAMQYLEELPGVKENGLKVRLSTADGVNVVYIEAPDGKIVRRIPEKDLLQLKINKEKKNGKILNKTA